MDCQTLQDFLEALLGNHNRSTIQAAMVSLALEPAEEDDVDLPLQSLPADSKRWFQLESFQRSISGIEKAMQPGTLKAIVSMRRDASGGDLLLLAKALKSVSSFPDLPVHHLVDRSDSKRWVP